MLQYSHALFGAEGAAEGACVHGPSPHIIFELKRNEIFIQKKQCMSDGLNEVDGDFYGW
jgi:hypothetical protein